MTAALRPLWIGVPCDTGCAADMALHTVGDTNWAICRGCQELNVALGGTLEAEIHEPAGRLDHRAPASADLALCFAPRHALDIVAGSLLHRIVGTERAFVNSLHRQSVLDLGQCVSVQARAPDGVVEAIAVAHAPFALGVQWHPESGVPGNAESMRIFQAFRSACAAYRAGNARRLPQPGLSVDVRRV